MRFLWSRRREYGIFSLMESPKNTAQLDKKTSRGGHIVFVAIAALLNLATWGSLYWKLPPSDDTFFLHYNIYFGVDQTGGWSGLLWIPGTGAALIVVNTLLVRFLQSQPAMISRMVNVMTALMSAAILVAMWLLITSNLA